jgi:S-(hydroxymethyl)mycothiol dehydrogenase
VTIEATGALLVGPSEISVEQIMFESPGRGQVSVRMSAAGVCHTDLHIADSSDGWGRGFPLLLGHEGSGIVEEVGPEVDHIEMGDHVAVACRVPCGACALCLRGDPRRCHESSPAPSAGIHVSSGEQVTPALGVGLFADTVVVDAKAAVRIPDTFDLAQASILGCAVMTGVGAVTHTARVFPGATVAVVGCGGIGLSTLQGARIAGAARIVAIDVTPEKLHWAKTFGATDTIDASTEDPVARTMELTEGHGVDFSFEAVGIPSCVDQCLRMLALGGVATLIGVHARDSKVEIPIGGADGYMARTRSLLVSHGGDSIPQHDLPTLISLSNRGLLDIDRMITHRLRLDALSTGFDLMRESKAIRSIVQFDDES